MSKYITLQPRKLLIEFRDHRTASVHGGQLAVAGLLDQFRLKERVEREPAPDPRTHTGKGYPPLVYVTALLHSFTSGGVSLADAERLNEDEPFKAFLGVEKLPDPTAIGQWLRDIGEAGWQVLRRISREFVAWVLARAEPARYRHVGRTGCFFDDTQIEVSGPSFEGAAVNYEGNRALSWQVLLVGPLLADHILGATSPTKDSPASEQAGQDVSGRLPELLAANAHLWSKAESYLYTDSASRAGKYLDAIAEHFGAWSVSYNKWTGPLEAKAAELPEGGVVGSGADALGGRQRAHGAVGVVSASTGRVRGAEAVWGGAASGRGGAVLAACVSGGARAGWAGAAGLRASPVERGQGTGVERIVERPGPASSPVH